MRIWWLLKSKLFISQSLFGKVIQHKGRGYKYKGHGILSESEVKAYHQNGYVVPKGFCFEKNELAKLQTGLNAVLCKNPTIMPDRLMNPHLNKGKPI